MGDNNNDIDVTAIEDMDFFKSYVASLVEDESLVKEKHLQAQPVYYGIWTCSDVIVPEGYGDESKFAWTDEGGSFMDAREMLQEIWENGYFDVEDELVCEDFEDHFSDEFTVKMFEDAEGVMPESISNAKISEYLLDSFDDLVDHFEISRIGQVAPDAMFLTKKEADDHFALNYYHYSHDAKVICMTAWRNPEFEKFMDVVKRIDFDNSKIAFLPNEDQ